MSWTQTDLDNHRAMIAAGVTEATYDGRTVKYRSLKELLQVVALMEADLGVAPARIVYPRFSKGV